MSNAAIKATSSSSSSSSMFKWKVSSLTSRNSASKANKAAVKAAATAAAQLNNSSSSGNTAGTTASVAAQQPQAELTISDVIPPIAVAAAAAATASTQKSPRGLLNMSGDNCSAVAAAVQAQPQQQQQQQQATFSPILTRSRSTAAMPQQQQQKQFYHQNSSSNHHYHHYQQQQQQQQHSTEEGRQQHAATATVAAATASDAAAASQSWNEWTQQLLAYTAWVNSQLRKRPELPLIDDMGNDLQDGVLVAKLIEIITGKEIRGIDVEVKSQQAKRENFENILTFLASQRVRTSTVTPRDLANGNLKSLMRLILSLASHYKPHSVKQGRADSQQASFRAANSQTTPNLNVAANRHRFQSTNDAEADAAQEAADMKTINAFATLRRQNHHHHPKQRSAAAAAAATATFGMLGQSASTTDLVMSPNVQRRFTMTGALGAAYRDSIQQQQQPSSLGSISNARSMANLQQQQQYDSHYHHHHHQQQQQQQHQQQMAGIIASSTSVGDLNTSEEDASGGMGIANRCKPILKKDSKYGSRRELPALGVSGVVSKGSRPSIFEFWENMLTSTSTTADAATGSGGGMSQLQQDSMTADVEGTIGGNNVHHPDAGAAAGELGGRSIATASSMRRILPALPNQQSSLTVYTSTMGGNGGGGGSAETAIQSLDLSTAPPPLGSRGEVEGSSNQPSPTCLVGENGHLDNPNISSGGGGNYWNNNNHNNDIHNPSIVKTVNHQHDMLVEELNRAKKQLAQLQKMLLTSSNQQQETTMTECKGTTTTMTTSSQPGDDPDAISWLRTTLHNVDQRCSNLQTDLKKAQQDCMTLDGSRRGLAACLANQEDTLNSLRQEVVRTNLANQTLINEKVELQRKLEERDRQIADLRRQLAAKDRVMETQRAVLEEASQNFTPALRAKLDKNMSSMDARRNQYREELQVARDALASLRCNFRGNDPNHHTLDTLEQCMAFLLERIAGPDSLVDLSASSSSHSTTLTSHNNQGLKRSMVNGFGNDQFTKVVYFTERTVTPFLTVIPRRLGDICLRDFKTLFDRPGVYRFHFKAQDAEYGFVKEEIGDDNMILPGFDGKIIAWVEEIQV